MKHAERKVIVTMHDDGEGWIHFEGHNKSASISLDIFVASRGPIAREAINEWFEGDGAFVDGPPANAEIAGAKPYTGGPVAELGEVLARLNVPIQFGLRQQGKLGKVVALRAEGKSWDEIGAAIGWHGRTVERFYKLETEL